MIYIETNIFIVIAVCIIAFLPTLVFSFAYLIVAIQEIKNKKKWVKKIITEEKGEKLPLDEEEMKKSLETIYKEIER